MRGYAAPMTENAGIEDDPRVAAAEDAVEPASEEETDSTQRMEDPAAVAEEPERLYDA